MRSPGCREIIGLAMAYCICAFGTALASDISIVSGARVDFNGFSVEIPPRGNWMRVTQGDLMVFLKDDSIDEDSLGLYMTRVQFKSALPTGEHFLSEVRAVLVGFDEMALVDGEVRCVRYGGRQGVADAQQKNMHGFVKGLLCQHPANSAEGVQVFVTHLRNRNIPRDEYEEIAEDFLSSLRAESVFSSGSRGTPEP